MEFYKRVELKEGVKVQFVGVYVLKWGKLDEPTDGFVQAEDYELIKYLEDKGVIIRFPRGGKNEKS